MTTITKSFPSETLMTAEEYFEFEKTSEVRHEFVNGKLYEMAGESLIANEIASNLLVFLKQILRKQPFKVYFQDVRLQVKQGKNYRYPDLVVTSSSDKEDIYLVTQPVLIAEVLSPSTESVDRNQKLKEYCAIPTLQYYLLISQTECSVECYSKVEDKWVYQIFNLMTDKLMLEFVDKELEMGVIYEDIF